MTIDWPTSRPLTPARMLIAFVQKIERPQLELSAAGKGILQAVAALLEQAPPES